MPELTVKQSPPALNWAALVGRWSFSAESVTFEGPSEPSAQSPYGLAVSNLSMRAGQVEVSITLDSLQNQAAGVVLGFKSEQAEYLLPQLGAHRYAYLVARWEPGFGWRTLWAAGSLDNLRAGVTYRVAISQQGENIRMAVDGVQVLDFVLPNPLPGNQVGLYGWGVERISFSDLSFRPTQPRIFVAMPFSEPFETLYREVILPEARTLGLEIVRVDEVAGPGIIFEDIKREITQASVVIAEVTAPNQNVFYELGYSHALNKPTILLAQRGKELPFDIRSYRVIFYDDTIGGKPAVERALRQHLDAVLRNL